MASPELCREGDRENVCQLALREVPDVVVLADHEALSPALGPPIDSTVELEDHGAFRE